MMLLNSTDTLLYRQYVKRHPDMFGYFISVRKRGVPGFMGKAMVGTDNECFNGKFESVSFLTWLLSLIPFRHTVLFVPCPDVVGDGAATLERFTDWHKPIKAMGFPVALVLQDGMNSAVIPWDKLDAVFVGGSTEWKLSRGVIEILKEAGKRNLWRHVGRVNSLQRMWHFWTFADSFDGTHFAIEPDGAIKRFAPEMLARKGQLCFTW